MNTLLRLNQVGCSLGGHWALRGVDLHMAHGERGGVEVDVLDGEVLPGLAGQVAALGGEGHARAARGHGQPGFL